MVFRWFHIRHLGKDLSSLRFLYLFCLCFTFHFFSAGTAVHRMHLHFELIGFRSSQCSYWMCICHNSNERKYAGLVFWPDARCTTGEFSTEQVAQDGKSGTETFKMIKKKRGKTLFTIFHRYADDNSSTRLFQKRSQATKDTLN